MNPESDLVLVPIVIAGVLGLIESLGLYLGWRWVYALGVPLVRYEETLAMTVPDVLPETTDDIPRVVRLADGAIGFLPRQMRLGVSGSIGGMGARGWGATTFGVIECVRSDRSTTFRFQGCMAMFPALGLAALLVSVCMMFRPLTADIALTAIVLFGGFIAAVVAWERRKLLPAYHVLTADLAAQGTQVPAVPIPQIAASPR